MGFDLVAILASVLGLVAAVGCARILLKRGWLLGWLRGMFGFLLLAVTLLFGFTAVDFYGYKVIVDEQSIGTISFTQIEDKEYIAQLMLGDGTSIHRQLKGDQWQLDAKIFKWSEQLAKLGLKPGYRLGRLSGRYYSIEQELNSDRTVYELDSAPMNLDIWRWFKVVDDYVPWLDALYGSAVFVPMADGAAYHIQLSYTGLLARPINENARQAATQWE